MRSNVSNRSRTAVQSRQAGTKPESKYQRRMKARLAVRMETFKMGKGVHRPGTRKTRTN